MSEPNRKLMDPSRPGSCFLRSTSAVSLHERFSQVLMDQLTRSRTVRLGPIQQQQRTLCGRPPLILLVKETTSSLLPGLQTPDRSVRVQQRCRRRRSVWTRLGWRQVTRRRSASRPRGFWSFRNKYRWRAGFSCSVRRRGRGDLLGRLGRCRLPMRKPAHKLTAGRPQPRLHLQRGGASASRGCGLNKDDVPTKKELDAQLDEYMSMSKSRLDKQLDDYMSMSRSRLDAELDEYMSMAGQMDLHWD